MVGEGTTSIVTLRFSRVSKWDFYGQTAWHKLPLWSSRVVYNSYTPRRIILPLSCYLCVYFLFIFRFYSNLMCDWMSMFAKRGGAFYFYLGVNNTG